MISEFLGPRLQALMSASGQCEHHGPCHAREVTTRTPSSRGGWNTGIRLYVGDTHALDEHDLGVKGAPSSRYGALVAALKHRLGDRFTYEQVT